MTVRHPPPVVRASLSPLSYGRTARVQIPPPKLPRPAAPTQTSRRLTRARPLFIYPVYPIKRLFSIVGPPPRSPSTHDSHPSHLPHHQSPSMTIDPPDAAVDVGGRGHGATNGHAANGTNGHAKTADRKVKGAYVALCTKSCYVQGGCIRSGLSPSLSEPSPLQACSSSTARSRRSSLRIPSSCLRPPASPPTRAPQSRTPASASSTSMTSSPRTAGLWSPSTIGGSRRRGPRCARGSSPSTT